MSVETVARRYATALADIVTKTEETNSVQTELKTWENMINANGDLQTAFGNPVISQVNKEKVLENLIDKTQPTKTTANFLRILLRNNRLTEIGEINEKFSSVLEERSGAVSAQITSARSLSEAEKAEMQMNLSKLTGKTVSLNFETDETLIGGVVTRIGSTVYDGSVKTQLAELKHQMIGS
ncbi:MAG: ATP synthase F1 subunit delta [Acidobacteriota bacterium]|jgi:F-type H+-transporting ATPase subunit delta|nr:ATP synthase F1 subunit delta [Acidobacteriota bacterium]MDQ3372392.1 ATP synthase F1 subunit delta [Acidobacteriota bacterium]